jgi:hypothetical protein
LVVANHDRLFGVYPESGLFLSGLSSHKIQAIDSIFGHLQIGMTTFNIVTVQAQFGVRVTANPREGDIQHHILCAHRAHDLQSQLSIGPKFLGQIFWHQFIRHIEGLRWGIGQVSEVSVKHFSVSSSWFEFQQLLGSLCSRCRSESSFFTNFNIMLEEPRRVVGTK